MRDRVLFVDDDRNITEAYKRIFYRDDIEVLTAESGREALEILETGDVAVVVSDERMPGMSGSEFLVKVRELYPKTVRIMLTGYATLEVALDAINRSEVYRFLIKPYSFVEFRKIVHEAVERRAEQREVDRALASFGEQAALLSRIERQFPDVIEGLSDEAGTDGNDDLDGRRLAERIRFETTNLKRRARRQ